MALPTLLYITPVAPNVTGSGPAMRAYNNLIALTKNYSVYLLVIALFGSGSRLSPEVLKTCTKVARLPFDPFDDLLVRFRIQHHKLTSRFFRKKPPEPLLWKYAIQRRIRFAADAFPGVDFQVVHVFRLYALPYAKSYLDRQSVGIRQLDLDDIESLACKRLSLLYGNNGRAGIAAQMAFDAELYEEIERCTLPAFDRTFVCSDRDKTLVTERYHCKEVRVVPNIVQIPEGSRPPRSRSSFTFLLVGSLGHYPNLDGLAYFCEEVLPLIRRDAPMRFSFKVVGGGIPGKDRKRLSAIPEVQFAGRVKDLSPYYADADAAVIPLRAGGGTRIKVLEAFSYRVPVISTTIGAEGLNVHHGKHLLLADTPQSFARECCDIMKDKDLQNALAANAFSLLTESYTPEIVRTQLCG
jgi:polysaccharide biosynthesis protein PslH